MEMVIAMRQHQRTWDMKSWVNSGWLNCRLHSMLLLRSLWNRPDSSSWNAETSSLEGGVDSGTTLTSDQSDSNSKGERESEGVSCACMQVEGVLEGAEQVNQFCLVGADGADAIRNVHLEPART